MELTGNRIGIKIYEKLKKLKVEDPNVMYYPIGSISKPTDEVYDYSACKQSSINGY